MPDAWPIRLAAALILSIVLHMTALVPWLVTVMTTGRGTAHLEAALDPLPDDHDPELGLKEGQPSSLDWVAFEEYEAHLARLAESNQADLTPAESAGPRFSAASHEAMSARESLVEIRPHTTAAEAAPFRQALPAIEMPPIEDVALTPPVIVPSAERWLPNPVFGPVREHEGAAAAPPAQEIVPPVVPVGVAPPSGIIQPAESSSESPAPGARASQTRERGQPSEKQSDPTSRIEVRPEQWISGKPLAAKGLELFPKKPHISLLDRMYRSPRNPTCLMHFDRRGVMVEAAILDSTGDYRIDGNLIDSLYGWRAEGKEIDALEAEDTVIVEMRFIFR